MADKPISALPAATQVLDNSLFVMEQSQEALSVTGLLFKNYAKEAAAPYAEAAEESATAAAESATQAASSATAAASSATTAQQYSGKPPIIQNGTWWTWNAESQEYEDTGEDAHGNVLYATFDIDPETGMLVMTSPDDYHGPTFALNNGYLEVSISA